MIANVATPDFSAMGIILTLMIGGVLLYLLRQRREP